MKRRGEEYSPDPGRTWTVDEMDSPHPGTTEPARAIGKEVLSGEEDKDEISQTPMEALPIGPQPAASRQPSSEMMLEDRQVLGRVLGWWANRKKDRS